MPENDKRVAAIFSPNSFDSYWLAFGEDAVTSKGIGIVRNIQPVTITRDMIGDAITQQINVLHDTPGSRIAVLEVLEH